MAADGLTRNVPLKKGKLKVLTCCTKLHKPHVVLKYANLQNTTVVIQVLRFDFMIFDTYNNTAE